MFLAASIGYNIGNGNNNNPPPNQNSSATAINAKVLKEIEDLKSIYDSKIAEKTTTYNDLETERLKVQQLLAELEKTKGDANALLKYKEQYQDLESKMRLLVDEIVVLKTSKSKAVTKVKAAKPLVTEVKKPKITNSWLPVKTPKKSNTATSPKMETSVAIGTSDNEVKQKVETAKPKVEIPEKKVEKVYTPVEVANLKSAGYANKSGKHEETNSANRTDLIKISFAIDANPNAKAEEKKYYIQVVNGSNKVLGRRITEFLDDRSITYSLSKTIQYQNQQVSVSQELVADDFEKGTYTVNVYDRSKLVAKTTFTLK